MLARDGIFPSLIDFAPCHGRQYFRVTCVLHLESGNVLRAGIRITGGA